MIIFQVGVCKGNDDLTKIIEGQNIDLLVLVEPLDVHNQDILNCYRNIEKKHLENIAIVPKKTQNTITFYYHSNDGPYYEVASLNKNHVLKHGYSEIGIVEKKVPCLTINELFEKYKVKTIDILFIDAEGMDDKIIQAIDFTNYKVKKIYFENLHLTSNIYQYLISLGYSIVPNVGLNGWSSLAEIK